MKNERENMTVRIVPLRSQEAGDARVGGSISERLALVAELSRRSWMFTGRPAPEYKREDIPFRLTTLSDQ